MTPTRIKHRRLNAGEAKVIASPLLEMKVAGKAVPAAQWRLDSVKELPLGFAVNYGSTDAALPLRCTVTLGVDGTPEAAFQLAVQQDSAQPVDAEIRFPVLHGLRLGADEDLQCFFPQYRNALGADHATYYAYAGVAFPMQFFDVFDERLGGGVWLRTEDRADSQRNYFLSKQTDGAHLHVEYPSLTTRLAAGAQTEFAVTKLGFHSERCSISFKSWLVFHPLSSRSTQNESSKSFEFGCALVCR